MQDVSTITPSILRGVFFVINPTEADFLFELIDPNEEVIIKIADKGQGAFTWNATLTGDYKFVFYNKKVFQSFFCND